MIKDKPLLAHELCDVFHYEGDEEVNGHKFEVYLDDYAMSLHLAWIGADGEVKSWSCGMGNNIYPDIEDIAATLD